MAEHLEFAGETGMRMYFCDPHSLAMRQQQEPKGLPRQNSPKAADLAGYDQAHLASVARQLNGRPRQTLDWMKLCEVLARAVPMTD